jgi:hypothetical protein
MRWLAFPIQKRSRVKLLRFPTTSFKPVLDPTLATRGAR